uniref:Uncharacterized protein n=1 Tax=Timema cristinae TaxID=61476 RepID=A0A7R9GUR9_TIMCR|nr:unnamed protein product [Timema cristinae]
MCVPPLPPAPIPPAQSAQRLTVFQDFYIEPDENLIEEAAQQPSIFDRSSPVYRDQHVKDNTWKVISGIVKSNGEQTLEKHWIPRLRLTTPRLRSQTRDAPSDSTLGVTLMLVRLNINNPQLELRGKNRRVKRTVPVGEIKRIVKQTHTTLDIISEGTAWLLLGNSVVTIQFLCGQSPLKYKTRFASLSARMKGTVVSPSSATSLSPLIGYYVAKASEDAEIRTRNALTVLQLRDLQVRLLQDRVASLEYGRGQPLLSGVYVPTLRLPPSPETYDDEGYLSRGLHVSGRFIDSSRSLLEGAFENYGPDATTCTVPDNRGYVCASNTTDNTVRLTLNGDKGISNMEGCDGIYNVFGQSLKNDERLVRAISSFQVTAKLQLKSERVKTLELERILEEKIINMCNILIKAYKVKIVASDANSTCSQLSDSDESLEGSEPIHVSTSIDSVLLPYDTNEEDPKYGFKSIDLNSSMLPKYPKKSSGTLSHITKLKNSIKCLRRKYKSAKNRLIYQEKELETKTLAQNNLKYMLDRSNNQLLQFHDELMKTRVENDTLNRNIFEILSKNNGACDIEFNGESLKQTSAILRNRIRAIHRQLTFRVKEVNRLKQELENSQKCVCSLKKRAGEVEANINNKQKQVENYKQQILDSNNKLTLSSSQNERLATENKTLKTIRILLKMALDHKNNRVKAVALSEMSLPSQEAQNIALSFLNMSQSELQELYAASTTNLDQKSDEWRHWVDKCRRFIIEDIFADELANYLYEIIMEQFA